MNKYIVKNGSILRFPGSAARIALIPLALLLTFGGTGIEAEEHASESFTVLWQRDGIHFEVTSSGDFELNGEETRIQRVKPGTFVSLRTSTARQSRQVEISAGHAGAPQLRFRIGGTEGPGDEASHRWLAGLLPEVVRETGLASGSRVQNLYRRGGTEAVLAEVDGLDKPRIQRIFLAHLLDVGLANSELVDVVQWAAEGLPVSGDLASFLFDSAGQLLVGPETREAFLGAAEEVESEEERAGLAAAVLEQASLAIEAREEMIAWALARAETDAVRIQFLARIAEMALADVDLQPAFFSGLSTVEWEDRIAQLGASLLTRDSLAVDLKSRVFGATFARLETDNTRAALLVHLAEPFLGEPELRSLYLDAAATVIDSRPRTAVDRALREHGGL
ncbi:MAG: hypothetical protein AAF657_06380 [Acidobacteriota bacterium]